MRTAVVVAMVLSTGSAHGAASAWLTEQTRNFHRVTGPFLSIDYGFRIDPPNEAAEYVTDGGDGNHGPILILGEGREIVVYPQYTGLVPGDDKPCGDDQTAWEAASKRTAAVVHLSGRSACIVTFTQGNGVERIIQAVRDDRGTGIMYTLRLTTTRLCARKDFHSFDKWRRASSVSRFLLDQRTR